MINTRAETNNREDKSVSCVESLLSVYLHWARKDLKRHRIPLSAMRGHFYSSYRCRSIQWEYCEPLDINNLNLGAVEGVLKDRKFSQEN